MTKAPIALLLSVVGLALLPKPSLSATFRFQTEGNLPGNKGAGRITEIDTTYDTETELFNWSSTFTPNAHGVLPDGAWLVVNDGPNPKGHGGELAIAYLDELNQQVSFYEYNGANKSNSYRSPGNFLASTGLTTDRTADSVTFSFDYDATDLNSLDLGDNWQGISFNDEIGIWFHGVSGLHTSYDEQELEEFIYQSQSWYDVSHKETEKIPEPSMLLGMLAIGGFVANRKLRG